MIRLMIVSLIDIMFRSQGQIVISLPDGHDVQGERSSILRMVLWLNTYYKFYCQKVSQ